MQRHFQKLAVTLSLISTFAVTWTLIGGVTVADAATRYRSGRVRANLADAPRIAANGVGASGLHLTGPDVMASVVGLMAILAVAFIVVTFIRRRLLSPRLTPSRAA